MNKILYSITEGFFKSIEIDDTELDSYLVKKNIPDLFPIKSEDGSTFETEHKDTTHHKILKGSGDWYYYEAKEDHENEKLHDLHYHIIHNYKLCLMH